MEEIQIIQTTSVSRKCSSGGGASKDLLYFCQNEYLKQTVYEHSFFFLIISLIADGPHHYHPACGH